MCFLCGTLDMINDTASTRKSLIFLIVVFKVPLINVQKLYSVKTYYIHIYILKVIKIEIKLIL